MATADRHDPIPAYNFEVKIDGVTTAGFSECSGISMETPEIEYRNGNEKANTVRKIPGLNKYGNITLKRGHAKDMELWEWRKKVIDGKVDRRPGSITLLNEARQPSMRWTFREAWPSKLDGPTFNAKTNEVAIETLELRVEDVAVEIA